MSFPSGMFSLACTVLFSFLLVLGIDPRTLYMLSTCSHWTTHTVFLKLNLNVIGCDLPATLVSLRSTPVWCHSHQLPSFISLHRLMPSQSLNTWYRQVQEAKEGPVTRRGERDREEVARAVFLEVAGLELVLKSGEEDLFSLKREAGNRADRVGIWWPSWMFVSFPDEDPPGFCFGREEERNKLPFISGEAMWPRRSKVNTHCQCWLTDRAIDLCLHPWELSTR